MSRNGTPLVSLERPSSSQVDPNALMLFVDKDPDTDNARQEREGLLAEEQAKKTYGNDVEEPDDLLFDDTLKVRRSRAPPLFLFVPFILLVAIVWIVHIFVNRPTDILIPDVRELLSNGTHTFKPTVIMISLDGFRADYLSRGLTPNLVKLAEKGLRAEYITPVFPSVTFPNHYTLVTGLYPESHGIVGNVFYDPDLKEKFVYTSPKDSWDPKWWGGEPIWVTATRQNRTSAVIMWPGCSTAIKGTRPDFFVNYTNSWTLDQKNAQVLTWLDMPIDKRPQFIGVYVNDVDTAGHMGGPASKLVNEALVNVDNMVGKLLKEIAKRNLTQVVNVIVVSDHGMTETSRERLIYFEDYLDPKDLPFLGETQGWPLLGIHPTNASRITSIYKGLKQISITSPSHFEVYLRDDIPSRWHFSANRRIPDIVAVPDLGWLFVTHKEVESERNNTNFPQHGTHGYDNAEPNMRAIFLAQGPGFVARGAGGKVKTMTTGTVKGFGNVEVYGIVARLLGVTPAANNGTMRGILEEDV